MEMEREMKTYLQTFLKTQQPFWVLKKSPDKSHDKSGDSFWEHYLHNINSKT